MDKEVFDRIGAAVSGSTKKLIGVSIADLDRDISAKLVSRPLIDFRVDTKVKFKDAKRQFKSSYVKRLLQLNYGNISEVARLCDVDRRSIHRMLNEFHIDSAKVKKELLRPDYVRAVAVDELIKEALRDFSDVIHPKKLEQAYQNVSKVSKDIVQDMELDMVPLKEAEAEFEKEYLQKALEENGHNISKTAARIGLDFAVLHRKIKALNLIRKI